MIQFMLSLVDSETNQCRGECRAKDANDIAEQSMISLYNDKNLERVYTQQKK